MTNQDIFGLIDRFEKSSLTEMKLSTENFKIVLSRKGSGAVSRPPEAAAAAESRQGAEEDMSSVSGEKAVKAQHVITAPMVGTFYAAPEPGQQPFVVPGAKVSAGQTVCLMEAMKMISEIPAPCDCIIEEVLKVDGELAAFGDVLFGYRPC